MEKHSLDRTAEFMRERLKDIPAKEREILKARGPLDRAAWAAQQHPGESLASGEGTSRVTRPLRGFLRRILWPELASQRRLDADLAEAVQALVRETRELSGRVEALERALAELSHQVTRR